MRFRPTAGIAAVVLIAIALSAGQAAAQSPPDTLVHTFSPLYLAKVGNAGGQLKNATPPAAESGGCGTGLSANVASGGGTFVFAVVFPTTGNGTSNVTGTGHYHASQPVTITLAWTSSTDSPQPGTVPPPPMNSGSGVAISADLAAGGAKVTKTATIPANTAPASTPLTFDVNATNFIAHTGGDVSLVVRMTSTPPQAGAPAASNMRINCGANSKMEGLQLIRGQPGEGDIDGDGLPDSLDGDKDGDGVPNTTEARLQCRFNDAAVDFSANRAERSGDHDGDGASDERECSKGFNPLSATSIPPRDKTLMDTLLPIILVLVLVGLIAGIIFVFLKYGKTVRLTIATTSELFIPAGTKGKYEITVENLAKKGEARTFQLVATGMPEGWDAKLNTDHLTLDPAGGAQNRGVVWLEVEAPQRTEPESAVVAVKAVPLNKAGRKDTLKLPGKAETITSINVPPGSKVPVKRGGKVVAAEPDEGGMAAGGVPIAQLGVDDAAAKKLAAAGVENSEQLRTADAGALHKKTKIPDATLDSWQKVSDLVRLGMTAAQANGLVVGGVASIGALANADPKEVSGKAGVDEKTGKAWVKAAGKWVKQHPSDAVAGAAPAAAAAAAAPAAAPAAGGAKPQLQVGGLKHEPPAFRQGETVKSSVSVSNNGGAASTIKLSLYVNEGLADVQTVTVKAGKAKDVQFKWTAQEKNKLNIRGEVVPG